jgi:hypothetical protein
MRPRNLLRPFLYIYYIVQIIDKKIAKKKFRVMKLYCFCFWARVRKLSVGEWKKGSNEYCSTIAIFLARGNPPKKNNRKPNLTVNL